MESVSKSSAEWLGDSVPVRQGQRRQPVTYPQARLGLGIAAVGTLVVLAAVGLRNGAPSRLGQLSDGSLFGDLLVTGGFFVAVAILLAPFDWLGGFVVPRAYSRSRERAHRFASRWFRAVMAQLGLQLVVATVLLVGIRLMGAWFPLVVVPLTLTLLVRNQVELAGWFGRIRKLRAIENKPARYDGTYYADAGSLAFSGGISGAIGRPNIIMPARWRHRLGGKALDALEDRRRLVVQSGSRTRSVTVSLVWQTMGVVAALLCSSPDATRLEIVLNLVLTSTLWNFVGLLVLPTLSRKATTKLDQEMLRNGTAPEALVELIEATRDLQDGEARRTAWIETIFHPLPAADSRLNLAARPMEKPAVFWNVARLNLFLSNASLNLLTRAVHCNLGRPDLWVMAPTD